MNNRFRTFTNKELEILERALSEYNRNPLNFLGKNLYENEISMLKEIDKEIRRRIIEEE